MLNKREGITMDDVIKSAASGLFLQKDADTVDREIEAIKKEAELVNLKLQKVSLEIQQDIVELDRKILNAETAMKIASLERLSKFVEWGRELK